MSEPYKIEVTTTAEVEAEDAILWIKQFSPDGARHFSEGLIKAIKSLQTNPFRCSLSPENEFFYEEIRQLIYGKYRILMTIADQTVYVLHIRHSSQKFVRQNLTKDED